MCNTRTPAEIMYEIRSQAVTGDAFKILCVNGCPLVIGTLETDVNIRYEQGLSDSWSQIISQMFHNILQ